MVPTDNVSVAIIIAVQGIIVALISRLSTRMTRLKNDTEIVKKNAVEAKNQVTNGHDTNFREEYDQRHKETIKHFTELKTWLANQFDADRRDISQNRNDINLLDTRITFLDQLKMSEKGQRNDRH